MEGVHINCVALPLQSLTRSRELQSRKVDDRPRRPVLAGNPLRVVERQGARLRGYDLGRAEELARCIGRVHREPDGLRRTASRALRERGALLRQRDGE